MGVSSGTLRILALMTALLAEPESNLIGIEEPENYVHPTALRDFAQHLLQAKDRVQFVVTTHSPLLLGLPGRSRRRSGRPTEPGQRDDRPGEGGSRWDPEGSGRVRIRPRRVLRDAGLRRSVVKKRVSSRPSKRNCRDAFRTWERSCSSRTHGSTWRHGTSPTRRTSASGWADAPLGSVDTSSPDAIQDPKRHLSNLLGDGVYTARTSEDIARRLDPRVIEQRSPSFKGLVEAVRNGGDASA